ncbi:hypothetical protein L204_104283 [Cryptococcus depauperatus]|nr:microfibrillar-associated protein 1 [Cryptococcus depauperatus CBS 7855]
MPPKPSKIRYFKGKAPTALSASESDEESEEEEVKPQKRQLKQIQTDKNVVAGGAGRVITDVRELSKAKTHGTITMDLQAVQVGRKVGDGGVKEESSGEEESELEDEKGKPAIRGETEEESSEYESSEESEEEVKKPAFRPVFIPKNARNMTAEKAAAEAEEARKKEEEMEAQRKLDSKELAGESIRRELAEKEAVDVIPEVDDTDGLDLSGEFEAWRARELARLLREKQAQADRDAEKEEIERRRAMPEEQRLAEDLEHARKTREKEKGQMGFLQKYYHKGAFHQDDELLNRDYTGATESAVDMTLLPKVMQVRDFGKASRTKYTHLTDQDTTQDGWGTAVRGGPSGAQGPQSGCFNCGGPHLRKDCPNNNINDFNMIGGVYIPHLSSGASGANSATLGSGSRPWGKDQQVDHGRDRRGFRDRDEKEDEKPRYSERKSEQRNRDRDYGRNHDRKRERERDHSRDRDRRQSSPGHKRARDERDKERNYDQHEKRRRDERDGDRYRDHDKRYK